MHGRKAVWENKRSEKEYLEKMYTHIDKTKVVQEMYDNRKGIYKCTIRSEGNEELIVAIPYNGMWEAHIDGKRTEVYREDIAYNGILLPVGEHEIILKYSNKNIMVGVYISLFSVYIVIQNIICNKKRKE